MARGVLGPVNCSLYPGTRPQQAPVRLGSKQLRRCNTEAFRKVRHRLPTGSTATQGRKSRHTGAALPSEFPNCPSEVKGR